MDLSFTKATQTFFTRQLLTWASKHDRPMPWKGIKDPYLIWLSEIILQQTRVAQGWAYFEKFKTAYPSINDLANASEDEVLKHWQGLGYYSRARNLHTTAKYISEELNGVFPSTYAEILKLKGVGPYTAAAIASFAYSLPFAVVDGNVFRVLSRFFGIDIAIDSTEGKKQFSLLAQSLLDKKIPGAYNQAIMDFGADLCTPKSPDCNLCPLQKKCIAHEKNLVSQLPKKGKKIQKKTRYFNYLVLMQGGQTYLEKRSEKDIWKGLYQYPLIETKTETNWANLQEDSFWTSCFSEPSFSLTRRSKLFQQTLTHQKIIATFWEIQLNENTRTKSKAYQVVDPKNLPKFAFPKIIDLYLKDNSLILELF